MVYVTNTPQGNEKPNQQYPQFVENFTQLNAQFGIDHTAFTGPTNNGKHQKLTMPVQAADPATAANELAFYTKTLAAFSELYMRRDGSGVITQMTSRNPVTSGGFASFGQSFIPGGMEIKWGVLTVPAGPVGTTANFSPTLTPFLNYGIIGFATAFNNESQFNVQNVMQTGITIASPGGGNCFWLAIGA